MKLPGLHVVARDREAGRQDFQRVACDMVSVCGPALALHLRLKECHLRELLRLAERLSRAAETSGGWCVVNERVDVALVAKVQGVQLGRGALPVPAARRLLGRHVAIGASVHSRAEAEKQVMAGADYLVLGTIFSSATHPGGATGGLPLVRACRDVGAPLVAIGGITVESAVEVLGAGADGVAVVGAVWRDPDPVSAASRLAELVVSKRREP